MKKLTALFLVCLLLLPAFAQGEERISWLFPKSLGGSQMVELAFDEGWFFSPAAEYRHELCILSLGMALSAFRGGGKAPEEAILRFMDSLGFSEPDVQQFDVKREDTIGTAIAWRTVKTEEGSFPLVMLAVSGGNYGDEWISNFDVGEGSLHRGFASAARKAADRAEAYAAAHQLQSPRFWLAGYSRGAAVSNLAAAFLAEDGAAPDAFIFAYTFATPRTVRGEERKNHPNIFNLVSAADLIPELPLASWGFERYGQTLYLPSSLDENAPYAELLEDYRRSYAALTGQTEVSGDEKAALFTRGSVRGLSITAGNMEKYEKNYRQVLSKAFTQQELNQAESMMLFMLLMNMRNAAYQETGEKPPVSLMGGADQAVDAASALQDIFGQHLPEIYFAWLTALPDGNVMLHSSLSLTNAPDL